MWFNPIMSLLLKSPLHGLISKNIMLVAYQGIKSGKRYSIPVNYVNTEDQYWTISFRQRTWWRNLRGRVNVRILLAGRWLNAVGEAIEDDAGVTAAMTTYLERTPRFARYINVSLDEEGKPVLKDVEQAARQRVMVVFRLV